MNPSGASFDLEPLHGMFTVRLHGLDLSAPLSNATLAEILDAFVTWSILVFAGQRLDEEGTPPGGEMATSRETVPV